MPEQKISWSILIECLNRTIKIVDAYIKYSSDMNLLITNAMHINFNNGHNSAKTNDNFQKNPNKFPYSYANNKTHIFGLQNSLQTSKNYSNNNINNSFDKFNGQNFQPTINHASNSNLLNLAGANTNSITDNESFSNKNANNHKTPFLVPMGSSKINYNSFHQNHHQLQHQHIYSNKNFNSTNFNHNNQKHFQNNSNGTARNFSNFNSSNNNSNVNQYRTNSNGNYNQQQPESSNNSGKFSNGYNKFRSGGSSGGSVNGFNFDG